MFKYKKSTLALTALFIAANFNVMAEPEGTEDPYEVTTFAISEELKTRGTLGGVSVDALGNIFVTNFGEYLWKIDRDGKVKVIADNLYGASGNSILPNGDLLQANFFGKNIYKISRDGTQTLIAQGVGKFRPVAVIQNKEGDIFTANCDGHDISKVGPEKSITVFAKHEDFKCPNGMAFGPEGNLYVVNFFNTKVFKVSMDGAVEEIAEFPGEGLAHIVYRGGLFYITQIKSHKVYEMTPDGEFTWIAGSGERGFEDGFGKEAGLSYPNGVALTGGGNYLVFNTLIGDRSGEEPGSLQIRFLKLPEKKKN